MQIILVCIVIFVPQTVTAFLDKEIKYDLDKVKIEFDTGQGAPQKTPDEMMRGFEKAGDAPAPPPAADDPMKAILDAVKKEEPKK